MTEKTWNIWAEGGVEFLEPQKPTYVGTIKAATFQQACDELCRGKSFYNSARKTLWGKKLHWSLKKANELFC